MRPVEQTRFFRPEGHPLGAGRGNCLAACVASIFEVPITQAESCSSGFSQDLDAWTREHYPALRASSQSFGFPADEPETLESWRDWPPLGEVHRQGYWIAGVYSHRIPDEMMTGCGCTERVPAGDPECGWCHGRPGERELGILWGLHAVVMHGDAVAWDPHPRRAEGFGPMRSATSWVVVDPALL